MSKQPNTILPGTKAVILAGGKGTRLHPYTTVFPKPLMPLVDRPILEVLLTRLHRAGVRDIVVSVGHLAELIMTFFGNGEKLGLNIEYAIEDKPLGTMGPLRLIEELGEHFFVMNGDVLTDLDLNAMYAHHTESDALMTIATHRREVKIDFGVLKYKANDQHIESFEEKPTLPYDVSMGVYLLRAECLELIPRDTFFGFDHLVLKMLEQKLPLQAYPHSGEWLDIGRPEDYQAAVELMESGALDLA